MSVQPIDFLTCAKEHAQKNDEINKRNAISRSYYAAYHRCFQAFPYKFEFGESMHKAYIDYLEAFDKDSLERKIGLSLRTLHSRRIMADYRLAKNLRPSDTAMQIYGVDTIFALLSTTP